MQPAFIFELLPAFGFLLCITSFSYLWLMRSKQSGVFVTVYAFQVLDTILGITLFYAGFHGSAVLANTDDNTFVRPIQCYIAFHISGWCVLDVTSAAILLILCFDQIISVLYSKTHKNISSFYLQPFMMFLLFVLSFGILKPAWSYAIDNSENSTILISPFCSMYTVFDDDFYQIELAIRMFAPLISLGMLFLAALILLCYQLSQNWQFKWSDNNDESVRCFNFALIRTLLTVFAIHSPVWFLKPKLDGADEICLRMFYAGVMAIVQPLILLKLFPDYLSEIRKFFFNHSNKRNWQSAEDPPTENDKKIGGLDFGSWYSTGGNILGEAGVPYVIELDAERQKSISFYYNEMERY
ncbi:hypothetical protein M3Y97_00764900 [Aphelenchoides bicaudatus]|nr:hypothetical protein M3Y97_00764900 [Aphelenchoides bicaudatus]